MPTEVLKSELHAYADRLSAGFQTRPDIATRISEVQDVSLLEELAILLHAQAAHKDTRRRRRLLDVLSTASSVLHVYTGIAEIAKAIDPTIGGLVYGTVFFLLTIASEKHTLENLILTSLEDICRLTKHVTCIQQLLPERALSEKLHQYGLEVHCKMLYVLSVVVDYTSRPWFRRAQWAILKPQKDIAAGMRALESSLMRLRDLILADSSQRIQYLERHIAEQTRLDRATRLSVLQATLRCPLVISPAEACEIIKRADAERRFNNGDDDDFDEPFEVNKFHQKRYYRLLHMGLFQAWAHSERGCFLVVEATNSYGTQSSDALWLSSALAEYAFQLRQTGLRVIYYRVSDRFTSLNSILSVIIMSVLSWDDSFCDHHQGSVGSALAASGSSTETIMQQINLLLQDWLHEHPSDPLYIIFDRLDLCLSDVLDRETVFDHLTQVLDGFARMVEDMDHLRLCIMVDKGSWPSCGRSRFDYYEDCKTKGCFLRSGQLLEVEESW